VCKVFETWTLALDLLGRSDVKPQKVKEFCNDKPQSIQNKPFLPRISVASLLPCFVEEFHRFYVYFTSRVKE
jgi:hypothetical protein